MTLKAIPKVHIEKRGFSEERMKFYRIVTDPRFDKFILSAIMLNTTVLIFNWYM